MLNSKLIKLKSGLRVAVDNLSYIDTVCLGIWVKVGSRYENLQNNGICHFLEHMVFKGTKLRDTYQISEDIEAKGGYINAWTSNENTAFYVKLMKEDSIFALEVLTDILANSVFDKEEIKREQDVIVQEIKHSLDNPDDVIYDYFKSLYFQDSPLGLTILGSENNVKGFSKTDLDNHISRWYNTNNMVISISGNMLDTESFLEAAEKNTVNFNSNPFEASSLAKPTYVSKKGVLVKKDLEQAQLIYAVPSVSYMSEDYFTANIISSILGFGMSSRLFKEVREKRGLVYSISSYLNSYADNGLLMISAACEVDKVSEVIKVITQEIKNLDTLTDAELEKVKKLMISGIYMGLEKPYVRAERMAKNILNFDRIIPVEETIEKIQKITKEDIYKMLKTLVVEKPTIAVLSNKDIEI